MIPGESPHYYRDDVAHHSELKPPTVPINCRPPFRDGSTRLVSEIASSLLALNVASFWQGGGDAGREGCHAPCARTVAIETGGRRSGARGGAADRDCAFDRAQDVGPLHGRRLGLALARGDNGRWSRRGPVPARRHQEGYRRRPEPDWAQVHRELKRKHVTLQLLWDAMT